MSGQATPREQPDACLVGFDRHPRTRSFCSETSQDSGSSTLSAARLSAASASSLTITTP